MNKRLKYKVVIVKAASRGIGFAIAYRYIQEGAKVILFDMKKKRV